MATSGCGHHPTSVSAAGYGVYYLLFRLLPEGVLPPEISDQTVGSMVAGMDAEIFRPDE